MVNTAKKEEVFKANEKLISIIYHLNGGMILHSQLITLAEIMQIDTSRRIKSGITDLIKAELLVKKQVLNTNNNMLIMTAFPIAKIEGMKSGDVSEIPSSIKTITNSILSTEVKINVLKRARKSNGITGELTVRQVWNLFANMNSTLCFPLKNINDYLETLQEKYPDAFTQDFRDELTVLKVNKQMKINQLAKYNTVEIDPEELRIKENYDDLKALYKGSDLQENFFNFASVKNSSCDIERLTVNNGRIEAILAVYQTRNGSIDRAIELAAWFYRALQRYNNLSEDPVLAVKLCFIDEETAEYYEEVGSQLADNNYGYRGATRIIEILKGASVRFPYCTDNIFVHFANLHITDYYNISF